MYGKEKFCLDKSKKVTALYVIDSILNSTYVKLKNKKVTSMDVFYTSYIKREVKNGHVKERYIYYINRGETELRHLHDLISVHLVPPSSPLVFSYKENTSSRDVAKRHVGHSFLYKLDIKDYFPSITREMITELYYDWFKKDKAFSDLSDKKEAAEMVAFICTRSDARPIEDGGQIDHAILPIGISPSSVISNAMLYDFDMKMEEKLGKSIVYSRYSDNLFISTKLKRGIPEDVREMVITELEAITISGITPFKVNKAKTQYIPQYRSQRVLGTVVNKKVNIPRTKVMKTRSAINHLFYESQTLNERLESRTIKSKDDAWREYNRLHSRSMKVFGNLSYFQAINHEKYLKYSAAQHAIKISLENSRNFINTSMKEKKK